MGFSISQSLLALLLRKEGDSMSGAIRTKERCPNCGAKYGPSFECETHKNHPSRFYVDFSWKGKKIRLYSNKKGEPLDSYRLALHLHTEIDEEIKAHTFNPTKYLRQDQTLFWSKNLLDRFLQAKIESIAPSYKSDYRRMADRAAAFFENKDVRDLRKLDLVNYRNHLESRGIKGKYQKNYLDLFKTFLRWCKADLEILDVIPSFPPVQIQAKRFRWMGQDDQIKILENLPGEDRPIIAFLMLHGCRPAEARALRVKDLDLKSGTITITSTFSRNILREQRKGRGSQAVTIPIHPESYDFMVNRARLALPPLPLCSSTRGLLTSLMDRRLWRGFGGVCGLNPIFLRISGYTMPPGIAWPPSSAWLGCLFRTSKTSSAIAISGRR